MIRFNDGLETYANKCKVNDTQESLLSRKVARNGDSELLLGLLRRNVDRVESATVQSLTEVCGGVVACAVGVARCDRDNDGDLLGLDRRSLVEAVNSLEKEELDGARTERSTCTRTFPDAIVVPAVGKPMLTTCA